jgi:hypothetical protein
VDIIELIVRSEWPVVVGGALLLFRRPVRELIARINLTKIDAWGLKAEFERELDKVDKLTPPKDESAKLQIPSGKEIDTSETRLRLRVSRPEGASPEAAVLAAWSELEANMRAMIDAIHPRHIGTLSTPSIKIDQAALELGLTDDEVASLLTLRRLRNGVAHSAETSITWDDAYRFMEATDRLLARMKKNWDERRKAPK